MSSVSELIREVRVDRFEATRLLLGSRWGKRREHAPGAKLYWQRRGTSSLDTFGTTLILRPGELALLPRALAHVIRDRPDTLATVSCPGMHQIDDAAYESEGAVDSAMIVADLGHDGELSWLRLLPEIVLFRAGDGRWFRDTLGALATMHALPAMMRDEIATSLLRALLAHALEGLHVELASETQLAAALAEVRANPAASWELTAVARRAGMSRSVFAERVHAVLGRPLGAYVRELRIARARELLSRSTDGIKQIATRVGYANDAAFARAFLRAVGESPSQYRRRARHS
jgi:AraC-like DNA-binding protein